uniref:Protein TIC 214 n=1 Tax=Ranzania japonica TaxID=63353 RepID=A0A4D6E8P2_9MAGN|nr:hypothetical chloroplast RF1 [Ranzania japonica]
MILNSFLLGNLVSLCLKILNSVVVVGLYYGFLTTFSIGPSYLFLLRTRVMEEGTEKEVAATTGFIMGQLVMFVSIYYAPLHLALGRPHTITVLVLPYLLFHFFWSNHKHFFDYGSTTRNSLRNLSIQCVFLNNCIFQLFNNFVLPSPTLARLVNIYMFRYNNKMLFVTSSFVGWLIGHILFMKWVGWVLFWIRQNRSIRTKALLRSNKYLVSELRNSMVRIRIISILLFITCVYYLGRIPSPIFTKKLKETSKTEERGESEEETDVEIEEETDVEIETTSETEGTEQEQEGFAEKVKDKDPFWFEKPLVTLLFDYKRWNRPLRYIKNDRFENPVRNEMSQYFFDTCVSDGKQRISFTYPPSLSTFFEMIQKKLFLCTTGKVSSEELYNHWVYTNEQKRNNLSNEFINRIEALDKESFDPDVLEKRTRLCDDETEEKCLPKVYDPFLNGPLRGTMKNLYSDSHSGTNSLLITSEEDSIKNICINKLYTLLTTDCPDFEHESEFAGEPALNLKLKDPSFFSEQVKIDSENQSKNFVDAVTTTYPNDQTILKESLEESLETNEIEKKVPRWSYKLTDEFEAEELELAKAKNNNNNDEDEDEESRPDPCIRSRKGKRVVIFTDNEKDNTTRTTGTTTENTTKTSTGTTTGTTTENTTKTSTGTTAGTTTENTTNTSTGTTTGTTTENTTKTSTGTTTENTTKTSTGTTTGTTTENTTNTSTGTTTGTSNTSTGTTAGTNTSTGTTTGTTTENTSDEDESEEVALTRYSQQSDFRRDLIKGSMRAQRRKTVIWELFQATVRSPLFFDRADKNLFCSFDISGMLNFIFRNWIGKGTELQIYNSEEEEPKDKNEEEIRQENERIRIAEMWDTIMCAQTIRGSLLLTQSILRKSIVLPSLIIAKNIGRMLLFQFPEWNEDFKAWNKEMHVKCTYNGVQLSEQEFPQNWLTDGIQIKIIFPFCLEPWHGSKVQLDHRDPMKKNGETENFCFLTVWGMETELPFGSPQKRPSFFKPVWKELKKKFLKVKKKYFIALRILKKRTKWVISVLKEKTRWILKIFVFIKKIMKEFAKGSPIPLFGLREINESNINTNQKNDINEISNQIIDESPIKSKDWINYSLTVKRIKDLSDRTNTIRNQIEKITKDKETLFITPDINISPNETSCDDNRLESPKGVWHILKRRSTRLIRKCYYFFKLFIEKIYIDILLCIIKSIRINVKLFLESKNKIFEKYSFTDKTNQEGIDETNPNTIRFISTIKNSLSNSNISNNNSHIFSDPDSLSQAYVFYKLSQTQGFNKYHLRSVLQYHGTLLFLKDRIKDSFVTQGIFHSESAHKKIRKFRMNEWQYWLRSHYHYQYDLSQTSWSRLFSKKWKKKIHQSCMVQTKNSKNLDLDKKDQLIHYEKQKNYAVDSLLNNKDHFKNYKYDRLSQKCIDYEDNKDLYIYGSRLKVNEDQEFLYNYNTYNPQIFNMSGGISLNNYLRDNTARNMDRKYFDWKIFDFCLKTKINIKRWTKMHRGAYFYKNKNTKTLANYYQIIDKIGKKDLFSRSIHKKINPSTQRKTSFNWMEINEEMQNSLISNLELWFFPELVSLYNAYKKQPWIIPINSLLLNVNGNETSSKKKNIDEKRAPHILSNKNKKKSIELENKKNKPVQGNSGSNTQKQANRGSDPSNQEKDVKKDAKKDHDRGSDIQKPKKKKDKIEAELDFILERYFLFQLRWDNPLNKKIIDNVKVYCLLLRLENPKEIAIASIERDEMSLDIMPTSETFNVPKLLKRGILIIEPARLSIKWDGQFFMYQILSISQVHKNKHQTNWGYQKKRNVDKNGLDKYKSIARHEGLIGNGDINNYNFPVLENILSPKRRRELRIRICLNSENVNVVDKNPVFCNDNNRRNCVQFLDEGKHLDIDTNKFIKLKYFLWPNYRLEDLACMNRYWFDTNNGSRFSMSRIHMYPRLRIS